MIWNWRLPIILSYIFYVPQQAEKKKDLNTDDRIVNLPGVNLTQSSGLIFRWIQKITWKVA